MAGRWRIVPLLAVAVLVAVAVPVRPAASQSDAAPPASASAIAELVRVSPAIGNLALTIRIGTSLAGHQNVAANSEVRSVDLGFIGSILAEERCDGSAPLLPPGLVPESVLATSTDPAAADGITGGLDGVIDATATATANPAPASSAEAQLAPVSLPGIASVTGGSSTATTSSDGHVATAITEIGRIELAGGLVVLEGLRWEVTHRLLPEEQSTSEFDLGRLRIGGALVPLPTDDLLETLATLLDPILDPLGIELSFPRVVQRADGVELTPLSVGVVPGSVRDELLAPIFGATRDPYTQLSEYLIELDCSNATYITVLDLVIGAVSGGGFTKVDLGGVTARASEFEVTSFLDGTGSSSLGGNPGPALPANDTGRDTRRPSASTPPDTTTGPVASPQEASAPSDEVGEDEQAVAFTPAKGERGGPLLVVGAVGLAGLIAAALGDRRRMRRAQLQRPM